MRTHVVCIARIFLLSTTIAVAVGAQQASNPLSSADRQDSRQASTSARANTTKSPPDVHAFWDRENDFLFAGAVASRGMDYSSTLNLRRRGDNEIFLNNAIVDNHPLFAGIEAAATVASIGLSYLFHRTGHHTLERWTSAVHIGVTVGGALRNYALPTQHPN